MRSRCLAWVLMATGPGVLACSEPPVPSLPDPHLAVPADMVQAQREVRGYLAAQEQFLDCVQDPRRHNAAVDKMQAVADQYNQAVRAYKARQKNQAAGSWLALIDLSQVSK